MFSNASERTDALRWLHARPRKDTDSPADQRQPGTIRNKKQSRPESSTTLCNRISRTIAESQVSECVSCVALGPVE